MITSETVHEHEWFAVPCTVLPEARSRTEHLDFASLGVPLHPNSLSSAHPVKLEPVVADSVNAEKGTAVSNALPIWAETLAVFDTETTGIRTSSDRIVSSSIALIGGGGEVLERYDWLLDPGVEIPEPATRVHGITTEIARASGVAAEVGIAQIVTQLLGMIERGFPVVAYNAPFDLSLLRAEARRHGIAWPEEFAPVIDPLVIDKQCDRYRKGKRTLEVVAAHYGVPLDAAHDAGEDAIAAGRVAQALALRYAHALPDEIIELHTAQIAWAASQAASFQEYMRRVKDPNFLADGAWPFKG